MHGIGTGGGWKMEIEDRKGRGYPALAKAAQAMMIAANKLEPVTGAFTIFNTRTPRLNADIDRERAEQIGVPVTNVFSTLGTYLGSTYINDFNYLGRTWRVTAQADARFRQQTSDIEQLKTRSPSGAMVPLGSVLTLRERHRPLSRRALQSLPLRRAAGRCQPGYSLGPVAQDDGGSRRARSCPRA